MTTSRHRTPAARTLTAAGLRATAALALSSGAGTPALAADTSTSAAAHHHLTPPKVTWMDGTDIHTASGRVIHVQLPTKDTGYLQYLGKDPQGWVVDGLFHNYVIGSHGQVVSRSGRDSSDEYVVEQLSSDGAHIISTLDDQDSMYEGYVEDLDTGRTHGAFTVPDSSVLAMAGNTIYVGKRHGTYSFEASGPADRTPIDPRQAVFIDPTHDLAFFHDSTTHTQGPTSLSDPGTPAWSAPGFEPLAVSPDGTLVVGETGKGDGTLQVRRLDDGTVLRTLPVHWSPYAHNTDDGSGSSIGFESDDSVVVQVLRHRARNALLRCPVTTSTRCVQATRWSSKPYTLAGPTGF